MSRLPSRVAEAVVAAAGGRASEADVVDKLTRVLHGRDPSRARTAVGIAVACGRLRRVGDELEVAS